ncbi:MAG: hypothetical protein ACK5TR_05335 [Alphaproteobacteria bacterium]|jgi:hypothetical protein|nr:hypothetical protein [Alphaproteobacteria bacterium]
MSFRDAVLWATFLLPLADTLNASTPTTPSCPALSPSDAFFRKYSMLPPFDTVLDLGKQGKWKTARLQGRPTFKRVTPPLPDFVGAPQMIQGKCVYQINKSTNSYVAFLIIEKIQ